MNIIDEINQKLKNEFFADHFLNLSGLEVLGEFLNKLPDGFWPNLGLRSKVFKVLLYLPVQFEHLENSGVGKLLISLEKSKEETEPNKAIIREIKNKWSRVVCHLDINYADIHESGASHSRLLNKRVSEIENLSNSKTPIFQKQSIEEASYLRRSRKRYDFILKPTSNVESVSLKRVEVF